MVVIAKPPNAGLGLVKVNTPRGKRSEVIELSSLFNARIVSVQAGALLIQTVDTQEAVDEFIELLKPYGLIDVSRSGVIARGKD